MTNDKLAQHISEQFNTELDDLRHQVLHMGALVKLQIALAMKAFTSDDSVMAEQIIKDDNLVDGYKKTLDQECLRILALRQPTAIDLRLIISTLKIVNELEIIGDLAEQIAKIAIRFTKVQIKHSVCNEVQPLADLVEDMLHDALEALAKLDVRAITSITRIEENVDVEYNNIMRNLITQMMREPNSVTSILEVLWAVRALERMGDHARHICEHLVFIVQGENVRHLTQQEFERKLAG